MGVYEDYPFYSDEGQAVLMDIFRGIYRDDETDAALIATQHMKKNVEHYMKNKVGIVFNIRKFLSSYTGVPPDDSYDSGIYICDHLLGGCGRRDFAYNWEYVDFGLYSSMRHWTGSVDFVKNTLNGQMGYLIMCRVRCNPYVGCLDCGNQWATKTQNATVCIYCNSTNIVHGGCGKEHWTAHTVREATSANLEAREPSMVLPQRYVQRIQSKGKSERQEGGRPFCYRITYKSPAYDIQINQFTEACKYIPVLEVGYETGSYRRPYGFQCDTCKHQRYFPPPSSKYPHGRPMDENKIDMSFSDNSHQPQTGGIYIGIGKGGNSNRCTECAGSYLPMMGWEIGEPKCLGPTDNMSAEEAGHIQEQQFARAQNALPTRYPLSALRFAFTEDPKIICKAHIAGRDGLSGCPELWTTQPMSRCLECGDLINGDRTGVNCYQCQNAGKSISKWKIIAPDSKMDQCPECGTNTDPANLDVFKHGGKPLLFPRKKLIIKPQHNSIVFDNSDLASVKIRGKSVWMVYVDSAGTDDYRFGITLPAIASTQPIPVCVADISSNNGGGSSLGSVCTHDPIMQPGGKTKNSSTKGQPDPQGACLLPDGSCIQSTEAACLAATGTYQGNNTDCATLKLNAPTGTGPCSGVTFSGLTYMITEGRSHHAFRDRSGRWVDDSVDCRSYRNPVTPETPLTTVTTYPRFMSGPTYDPRVKAGTMNQSQRYEWCNTRSHVLCDPFHLGGVATISNTTGGTIGITTHDIKAVGTLEDPNIGREMIIKCSTCEKIARVGERLAKAKDPQKKGTPYPSSDWTTIGGAASLQEAFEKNIYHPGVGVLMYRKQRGQIKVTGWTDSATPILIAPKIRQYGVDQMVFEIKLEQSSQGGLPGGWWNWSHDSAAQEGSWKARSATGTTITL